MTIYKPEVLSVEHLNFVAIGKMSFSVKRNWSIPHLHYMINKIDDEHYEAICLETRTFASASSIEDVAKKIVLNIVEDINNDIKCPEDLDKIIEDIDTHFMDAYWKEYRKINFNLAKIGKDINTEMEKRIKEEVEKEVKSKLELLDFTIKENKRAA